MSIVQRRDADHPANIGCAQTGCKACLESLLHHHEALIHFIPQRQLEMPIATIRIAH